MGTKAKFSGAYQKTELADVNVLKFYSLIRMDICDSTLNCLHFLCVCVCVWSGKDWPVLSKSNGKPP